MLRKQLESSINMFIGREKELKDLTSEVLILKIKTLRPHLHSYNGCTY